jgi:predicted RNA-binding protein with PIN domain
MPQDVSEEVIADKNYDPDTDKENPSGSIFIDHGAGYYVPWFECESMMHLDSRESEYFNTDDETDDERLMREAESLRQAHLRSEKNRSAENRDRALGTDEIDDILRSATHSNAGNENRRTKRVYLSKSTIQAENRSARNSSVSKAAAKTLDKKKYLLVDGYNIIHAWEETADLAAANLDSARDALADVLSDYQGSRDGRLILVFDAYRVRGHAGAGEEYGGIHVVYTREAETADNYIERTIREFAGKKDRTVRVATSDGLEQVIILGGGATRVSAREFRREVEQTRVEIASILEKNNLHPKETSAVALALQKAMKKPQK